MQKSTLKKESPNLGKTNYSPLQMLETKADDWIAKPVEAEQLLHVVKESL